MVVARATRPSRATLTVGDGMDNPSVRDRTRGGSGPEWADTPSSTAKVRKLAWVGLLARDPVPCPSLTRVRSASSGMRGAVFVTYSGGTAPDFHRTSLLRPCGHPKR